MTNTIKEYSKRAAKGLITKGIAKENCSVCSGGRIWFYITVTTKSSSFLAGYYFN